MRGHREDARALAESAPSRIGLGRDGRPVPHARRSRVGGRSLGGRSLGRSLPEQEEARSFEPSTVHSDRSASTGLSRDARLAAGTAARKAVSSRHPIGIAMLNASVGSTSWSNPQAMDLRGCDPRDRQGMSGQPHRHRDAHRVHKHRGRITRHDAQCKDAGARETGPDPATEDARHHAEGGTHEVQPRARLLDQKQRLARQISLPRFPSNGALVSAVTKRAVGPRIHRSSSTAASA